VFKPLKKFELKSYKGFKELIKDNGYDFCVNELKEFTDLIDELNITVLKDHQKLMTLY
jgi:predicted DNA-binding antitoxin AbrB/MazE fold protein